MARKKKDNLEQNDIQVIEVVKKQEQDNKENKEQNKENKEDIIIPDTVIRDTRTLEQKLNSYKRKIRRI